MPLAIIFVTLFVLFAMQKSNMSGPLKLILILILGAFAIMVAGKIH